LSSVTGVEINGNQSVAGKNLGYYIRGGKNNQVLIVIDGIPVTDASGINFQYDLNLLPANQVESIEIMKGAASTLYGSGAATGIINIVLKKSSKKSIEGKGYSTIGTNNTALTNKTSGQEMNQGFSVSGEAKKINYLASLNSTEIHGMSQIAEPNKEVSYEDDRFSRLNLLSKIGFQATEKVNVDCSASLDRINNEFDGAYDNTGTNDVDKNTSKSEQIRFGFTPKYKYNKGTFILNSGFTKIERSYNEFNSYANAIDLSKYSARSINADGYNKYEFSKDFFLVTGAQYQFHDMNSETPYSSIAKENTKFIMIDPYFTGVYNSDFGLNINAGARWNIHSQYGNQLVYNVNPSFDFKAFPIKVLASYSTAFITPSLYQLYSEYGNSDLTPEKNATAEAGFEVKLWNKKAKLNAVAFFREQTNFIGFYYNPATFAGNYINIDGTNKAKGLETELLIVLNDKMKWSANYTFTEVDKVLDRLIPKHKMNSEFNYQVNKRAFFTINYQYVDARIDAYFDGNSFATQNVVLDSYQLVNATIKYELIQNRLSLFASATNIFNTDFVENIGYNTRGRNFKLGLNINL